MEIMPTLEPPTPYISTVDEGQFIPGRIIRVQGLVPGNAHRFTLNLQCETEIIHQSDIALQMSIRLRDGFISLNSLQNKVWDAELRGPLFPIESAKKFEIIFECEINKYKVTINSQHYCDFPQRIHYDDVTHLVIDGDVVISKIAYEAATKQPIKPPRGIRGSVSSTKTPSGFQPISYSPTGRDTDDYDNTETGVKRRRSYEAAINSTQGGYVGATYASSTPTLSDSPRVSPNIVSPYPTNGAAGELYQIEIEEDSKAQSTVPLNREPSDLKEVENDDWRKCWANCCGALIGGIFILGFVLLYI